MREILFRGKRIDNGEWAEGNLFIPDLPDTPTQICIGTNVIRITYDVIPETVGQFARGLTDKNGKKIFEGDILKWDAEEWGAEHCEPVVWDYSFLGIRKNDWKEFCEVIGNIHDNPELLEDSQ